MQDKRCCCLPLCSFSPALPSSSHLLFASTGDGPFLLQSSRRCVADLNVMTEEKEGWVGLQRLRAVVGQNPTSCAGRLCFLFLSLSLFCFHSQQHQVVCCLPPPAHLKCHSASPGQSPRAMQITYQHKAKRQTCV